VRVDVVWTGNVLHVDHVDGKTVRGRQRLEDAAIADAAAFAVA
jgi:hypothetical protein